MKICKIVITGGPCGGKSTALSEIRRYFTEIGYTVLSVPETATELIGGGVAPWTCKTNEEYQKLQLTLQLEKERLFSMAAKGMNAENIIIVCDRGAMDNKAYMTASEFKNVLEYIGMSEEELTTRYDGVFHLVTAAKGAEKYYTCANNQSRTETPEMAIELDEKLVSAWSAHPYFREIDNSTDFSGKISRLIDEIILFLKNI